MLDPQLYALAVDRERLLRDVASVLGRVGTAHPGRAQENARRSKKRKRLKRALRQNAELLTARVMQLYAESPYRDG
jgi:hypothetical protein